MARPRKSVDQTSTVSVSLRVDPAIKYAIDLAARIQKRTVTGVVEWSVEKALGEVTMPIDFMVEGDSGRPELPEPQSVIDAVKERLWSPDEAIRLVRLAFEYPSLLSFEESLIWESIRLSPPFWKFTPRVLTDASPWKNARLVVISQYWETLVKRVRDEGGIVQVSYEDVGLPTPLELEERKAQAIKDSSGYLEELALENDRLMRENKALKYLTDNLKDFLMKIDPQTAKLIEDLPPKP
ncbi:TPA: hypothetical protein NJJ38_003517 [Pseudomonas aeruginosa]|uniref:hypothetical protein n=1 Tax=Pseudomonas aeruginosa TaxID=287 RepID=UPI0004498B2A|nr:hypothetical protein [Pseudomonas aeruginosa]EIU1336828.1 hypothetical protein [Pseudomonas aeruginosa]EIU5017309.1 hypothetical protein [Pseudomonas aeruginosa]EIU5245917.1 hypothetical protein [Pseudomonas aeruginosa]EIZ7655290.1 hypothetical protein [Pseudomonas aeruginosa]EJV1368370.1 hypothetical protein [Pseudomonas aeruginosa]